ncbi:hypothetical protein TRFO_28576 [Tritrichomonas foetus]|uniref:Uncharacterized protein n=1 Tax=Tritrichomonas foetus TaxID=1144522 RepID=A0A1J4JZ62_9EUKA|nr:hypothetical protein TRFO_28576 [Tritrichomonas foetus]|eukprot:OHT03986.1 hypothetical protein TRFO_28576 [Tritrichomonas foetus]
MEFLELPNIEKNDLYLSINKTILIKVIIPLTVRKIRSNAFAFGENLEEIILYKGQEFIDDDSFEGCKKIMKLIIETNKNSNKSFIFEHMFYVE